MEIECQSIHTMVYHGSTLDSQINYRLGNKASRKVVLNCTIQVSKCGESVIVRYYLKDIKVVPMIH